MAKTKDILKLIKDKEIEWVDVRFTDPKGKWQHVTIRVIGERRLTDGTDVRRLVDRRLEGDQRVRHDAEAGPGRAVYRSVLRATDADPVLRRRRALDRRALCPRPRSIAKRAEAYVKSPASATPSMSAPKPNSSSSTTCASTDRLQHRLQARFHRTADQHRTPSTKAAISATVRAPRAATSRSAGRLSCRTCAARC
jgi:hypothetical protein